MISKARGLLLAAAAAAAAGAAMAAAPAAGGPLPIDPSWSADPIWDDGLAEVSVYDAERVIYGKTRPHTALLIVVKEDLSDASHVKADPPHEGRALTTVLKMNLVATVPTENYAYHFLGSFFVRRDDVRRLVKATVGSQEWCGNTFKEIVSWGGTPRIHSHSYFDSQGDGEQPLPTGEDGLLDEQILMVVRAAAIPEGGSVPLRVADPIIDNTAKAVSLHEATLTAGALEDVTSPAGRFRARRFVLRRGTGEETSYWVESAFPRALVRMEAFDGRRMILRERSRRDYWSR